MHDLIIQILLSLLLFGSLVFLIWALFRFPVPAEPPVHRRTAVALGAEQRSTVFDQPALAPLANLALTLARRFTVMPVRQRIRRDLDGAGNPLGYSVDEYVAVALMWAAGLGVVGAVFTLIFWRQFDPLTILALTMVGFFVPVWTLHEASRARILRISKRLPYTLDLIALTMAAGSTFTEAIATIIRDDERDDLNQELRLVQAEIGLGTTRSAALANLAERIPLDPLRSIVGAVNQAELLGTPLSEILKNQSSMLRMHRSVRAEKLSASASLRILFPSMLILLAVVMIVLGPVALAYVKGKI